MFAEKQYKELRSALRIDQMRLNEELIEQPSRLQSVTELAADALQIRDACKSALAIEQANAGKRIREASEEKLSDPRTAALALLDPKVQQASQELEDADHDLRYWQGLVDAYKDKSSSMKRIAELTIAGYLAPNAAYAGQRAEIQAKRRPIIRKQTE